MNNADKFREHVEAMGYTLSKDGQRIEPRPQVVHVTYSYHSQIQQLVNAIKEQDILADQEHRRELENLSDLIRWKVQLMKPKPRSRKELKP